MICENCGKEFFEDWRKDVTARKTPCKFCCVKCSRVGGGKIKQVLKGSFACKFCGTLFTTKSGKTTHEKYCSENPNKKICKGHKVSEETKIKLSNFQKEKYKNKVGWNEVFGMRKISYAEKYFIDFFENFEDKPIHNLKVDRYWLDFAWENKKIYFEVDGEQHYTEKGIEHDIIRDNILRNNGWLCIDRLRWSAFQKLSLEQKNKYLTLLKNKILNNGNSKVFDFITEQKDKQILSNKNKEIEKQFLIEERKKYFDSIDTTKYGWLAQAERDLGISHTQIRRWLKKYYPEKETFERK